MKELFKVGLWDVVVGVCDGGVDNGADAVGK
jgi:hypothetical protein